MPNVSAGESLASVKGEIFEAVLWFLPEWAQLTVLALIVLAVLASWILKLKRRIAHRRAVRAGAAVPAAAQSGQGRGADHLGAYAPQQRRGGQNPSPGRPSGADFLGAYAPQRDQRSPGGLPEQPQAPAGPSGADFLGAYAPQSRQGDAR
ncbi:hypothetical protein ACIHAR_19050 [Streptomyces sp. NPDC052016]|uniref:hypothetical protein n=1 Tax=Streptomyces sp. NPDC052016 TaxID=3365680 RepID=UPI0037D5F84C